jgi:dipeptidyl aminopeptidase/acylaminoacyl peptidase
MKFSSFMLLVLFVSVGCSAARAADSDGKLLSSQEYQLPLFETSGFHQSAAIKIYYETEIRGHLDDAKLISEIDEIEYASDNLKVRGFILKKRDLSPGEKLPILIWNRGGNRDFGDLDVNDMLWLANFSKRGYLVLASDYRGNAGEVGADEFGGNDVHDVLNLIKLAKSLPSANANEIYVLGHSRGGMETYLTLKADPEIRAAATLAGECDLAAGLDSRPDFEADVYVQMIPGYAQNKVAELTKRSACMWADQIHTPLFILQGKDDQAVDPSQGKELAHQMHNAGNEVKLEMFKGAHNLWFQDENVEKIINKLDVWFRSHAPKN